MGFANYLQQQCVASNRAVVNLNSMKHEPCSAQIVLLMPAALREGIERAAFNGGCSLANMTRRILERWAAEHSSA